MPYNSGFYKLENKNLLYGPSYVLNENYSLYVENKDEYEYPIDGWYWFEDLESACNFLNLDINDYLPPSKDESEVYKLVWL